jgi:hypothetical protein
MSMFLKLSNPKEYTILYKNARSFLKKIIPQGGLFGIPADDILV